MKGFKKFLIYLGIFLAIIVAAFVICIAIMYFSPRTSILGFEYVNYSKAENYSYSTATGSSYANVKAIEVKTNRTDIYIYPNNNSNKIEVKHNQGLSGFVKSINSNLTYNTEISTKSFEESLTNLKTLIIDINEPEGWITENNPYIVIYVPTNLTVDTYNINSENGEVYYYSDREYEIDGEKENKTIKCNNLYLKSGGFSDIYIHNTQNISNYYLTTDKGDILFKDVETLSANNLKFTTNAGGFNLVNAKGTATLNLTGKFVVKSYAKRIGPYIRINKLNANMEVEAYNGKYIIDTIGTQSSHKQVVMTMNKCNVNFGTVYAYVSILSEGDNVTNNVNIKKLEHTANTNVIESGSGSIYIESLKGNASLDATSGNVTVKKATTSSSIYAYTTSGSIDIKYEFSEVNNYKTKLAVLTHRGGINLENVSCLLELEVLSNSSAKARIVFSFIACDNDGTGRENIINAKNRKINILLYGTTDSFQSRMLTTGDVEFVRTVHSKIGANDDDNPLKYSQKYEQYTNAYRVGYTKSNDTSTTQNYDLWGKILINSTGKTIVEKELKVS